MTTSKQPKRRVHNADKTKSDIKKAAVRLLRTRGITKLSSRQLVAELDVSTGALFHHFPSKNHLIAAALEEIFEELSLKMDCLSQLIRQGQCSEIEFVAELTDIIIDAVFFGAMEVALIVRSEPELAALVAPSVEKWRNTLDTFWAVTFEIPGLPSGEIKTHWAMAVNMLRGQALASSFGSEPIERTDFCNCFRKLMLKDATVRPLPK